MIRGGVESSLPSGLAPSRIFLIVKLLRKLNNCLEKKMPSRINNDGYVCMYGSRTFVTKFEKVAMLLNIAEEIRKQSGSDEARKLLSTALEEENKLSRMYTSNFCGG